MKNSFFPSSLFIKCKSEILTEGNTDPSPALVQQGTELSVLKDGVKTSVPKRACCNDNGK